MWEIGFRLGGTMVVELSQSGLSGGTECSGPDGRTL